MSGRPAACLCPRSGPAKGCHRHGGSRPRSITPCRHKRWPSRWDANDYQDITWREGTHKPLCSQFAAVRVRVALGQQKREPEWLLIEWPQSDAVPAKYWLSNLPEDTSLTTLVATAKGRWRIERDCQELKQAFGLKHYEDWRGFHHHHATLCTVAYGFLVMEHLRGGDQKKSDHAKAVAVPEGGWARGHKTRTTPRG